MVSLRAQETNLIIEISLAFAAMKLSHSQQPPESP
jgi:hypothetical protein